MEFSTDIHVIRAQLIRWADKLYHTPFLQRWYVDLQLKYVAKIAVPRFAPLSPNVTVIYGKANWKRAETATTKIANRNSAAYASSMER